MMVAYSAPFSFPSLIPLLSSSSTTTSPSISTLVVVGALALFFRGSAFACIASPPRPPTVPGRPFVLAAELSSPSGSASPTLLTNHRTLTPSSENTAAAGATATNPAELLLHAAKKCQRADFGVYRAEELRRLASVYDFQQGGPKQPPPQINHAEEAADGKGGTWLNSSCRFDSDTEPCAWYGLSLSSVADGSLPSTMAVGGSKEAALVEFRRARFESFFDLEKFDCTSDRSFPFDDYFLVFGPNTKETAFGRSEEMAAALELRVPCQRERAMLKFDYWSNNETPVLKICVLSASPSSSFSQLGESGGGVGLRSSHPHLSQQQQSSCEEAKLDANPLTFEIPPNELPFRLRIQVEHVGADDIIFIDNVHYEGGDGNNSNCRRGIGSSLNGATTTTTTMARKKKLPLIAEEANDHHDDDADEQSHHYPSGKVLGWATATTTGAQALDARIHRQGFIPPPSPPPQAVKELQRYHQTKQHGSAQSRGENFVGAWAGEDREGNGRSVIGTNERIARKYADENTKSANTALHSFRDLSTTSSILACSALSCDFNHGSLCNYRAKGLGASGEWQLGETAMGNLHTGLHKPNPLEKRISGYAYVEHDDDADKDGGAGGDEIFVMESPRFTMNATSAYLVFDLFQRSVGPQLRVCINNYSNCPYANPPIDAAAPWMLKQRVLLKRTAEKVFFVAGRLKQNLLLAVDNIRLETIDFHDYLCQIAWLQAMEALYGKKFASCNSLL